MRRRRGWNYYHHTVGHVVVLLGFANALIGLYVGGLGWGWYLGVALVWCAILAAALAKWLRDACVEPRGITPARAATELGRKPAAAGKPQGDVANGQP